MQLGKVFHPAGYRLEKNNELSNLVELASGVVIVKRLFYRSEVETVTDKSRDHSKIV